MLRSVSDEDAPKPLDVALLLGPAPSGDGTAVLRARDGRVEAGVVRELREGRPLHGGEVVRLTPREGAPAVCDVEVHARVPGSAAARPTSFGPAQVASDAYRASWERTFARGRGAPN